MSFSVAGETDAVPFDTTHAVADLTLVEIAEQLEKVTGWIETQRVREREARAEYTKIQEETEAKIKQIRDYAQKLVQLQQKRVNAFGGILGMEQEVKPMPGNGKSAAGKGVFAIRTPTGAPKNLAEAIMALWGDGRPGEALTTEEIAEYLPDIGYKTDAAASSIKSSVNQALAKLCKVGRIVRLRADGSIIPPRDKTSRARKYLAAARLPEGQVL